MQSKSEIDFFGIASLLWSRKVWIVAGTALVTVLAGAYAWTRERVYEAEAVLAPKEGPGTGGPSPSLLAGSAGLGAMAMQLGMGNANLDRIEVILKSRELAEDVIRRNDLLPVLYPDLWNPAAKSWIAGAAAPDMRAAVDALRGLVEVRIEPKKKLLRMVTYFNDSTWAARIATAYLEALKTRIQEDTRQEAEGNRQYLEAQLAVAQDPLIRSGILNLIAMEIEKSMLVSTKAFDVLEKPVVPRFSVRPNRKKMVMAAFVAGLFLSSVGVVFQNVFAERSRATSARAGGAHA